MSRKQEKTFQEERSQIIDILRKTRFHQFDPTVHHRQVIPYATYSPWEGDAEFLSLFSNIENNTLVDIYRCFELWELVKNSYAIDGDILEVGVWRGGTGAIICKAAENSSSKVYLADTFEGVVKATEEDTVYRGGEHSDTSDQIVKSLLTRLNVENAHILKGVFPDDFTEVQIEKLKLCHIDVDTYQSAKDIFDYAWPKIQVGGVVVFDDYGFWTCEGVTKYFNALELADGRKIHNLNGHGIIIKIK